MLAAIVKKLRNNVFTFSAIGVLGIQAYLIYFLKLIAQWRHWDLIWQ